MLVNLCAAKTTSGQTHLMLATRALVDHQVLDVSLENVLQELGDRLHSRERCAAWRSGLSRCLSRYDGHNDDDKDNDGDDGDDEHGDHVTDDDDDDCDDDYDALCLSLAVMLLLYVRPCMRPCDTLLLMR